MTAYTSFAPPANWPVGDNPAGHLVEAIRGPLTPGDPTERPERVTLLDTADHRLARASLRLESRAAGKDGRLWTLVDADGTRRAEDRIDGPDPVFTDALAKGELRRSLNRICRGRALRAVADVTTSQVLIPLRDDEGKIRCRVIWSEASAGDNGPRAMARIEALKGYAEDAARVEARLAKLPGWTGTTGSPLDCLWPALLPWTARDTGGVVRADDPAGPVIREILSTQLDVMEDRLAGVLADAHPSHLHKFRVAVRQTRSALSQLSAVVALDGRPEAIEGFRWLGRVTGPARDLDIQLLQLAERRADHPGESAALDPLERYLTALKTAAHRTLVLELSGPRFVALVSRWRASLSPSSANWTATELHRAPFRQLAADRAARILRRVLREGRQIHPETDAEALHELRKRMKKLRYVVEFLGEAVSEEELRPAVKALKVLQNVLGRIQDREIQTASLLRSGRALADTGSATPDSLMAIGAWREELTRDQRDARAGFAQTFAEFIAPQTQAHFHAIFAPEEN